MGSLTFLNYTNRVLEDVNETTLTALSSSRGVQTVAKNSVNRAINDVSNSEVEWPFLHTDKEQDTFAGVAEYDLPSDHKYVDFDSFMLLPQDVVSNGSFTSNITGWTDGSSGTGFVSGSPKNGSGLNPWSLIVGGCCCIRPRLCDIGGAGVGPGPVYGLFSNSGAGPIPCIGEGMGGGLS